MAPKEGHAVPGPGTYNAKLTPTGVGVAYRDSRRRFDAPAFGFGTGKAAGYHPQAMARTTG